MTPRHAVVAASIAFAIVFPAAAVNAQSLGTFSWQLQPFCNSVTVNVTQQGAVFTIDGYDDQCGAPQRAPLVGTATQNPDGTIGFGLHIVTVPGGRAVHIDGRISLGTLGGPWSDSAGNQGTFAFAGRAGGPPRPVPTIPASALAPASITAVQLAPSAVTTASVADGSITPQKLSVAMPRLESSGLTTDVTYLAPNATSILRSVTIQIPSAGQVMANASGLFGFISASGNYLAAWCSISTGAVVETSQYMYARFLAPITVLNVPFAGTRVYSVTPGPFTLNLVCTASAELPANFPVVTIQTAGLTALFVPN